MIPMTDNILTPLRTRIRGRRNSLVVACSLVATSMAPRALAAQAITAPASVASHPEVLGAERLFSAWMEGQIAYRGLPGIAVGVVKDQELVWSKGDRKSVV